MSLFILAAGAQSDLDDIARYLKALPQKPASRIHQEILGMLLTIASSPWQGPPHSAYSRIYGQDVRSRLTALYRIYYFPTEPVQIIAILHTARKQAAIMAQRVT